MDLGGDSTATDVSLLFQDQWTTPGLGEIERSDQRIVAGADDDRVVHPVYSRSSLVLVMLAAPVPGETRRLLCADASQSRHTSEEQCKSVDRG